MNKDGGPAFPRQNDQHYQGEQGMSLRDWFAGMALGGYMVSDLAVNGPLAAQMCYEIADAMIAERDKEAHNDEERT